MNLDPSLNNLLPLINSLQSNINSLNSQLNSIKSFIYSSHNPTNSYTPSLLLSPFSNTELPTFRSDEFITIYTDNFFWNISFENNKKILEIIWEHPLYNLQGCFIIDSEHTNISSIISNLKNTLNNYGEISFIIRFNPTSKRIYFNNKINKYLEYSVYQLKDIHSLQFHQSNDIFDIKLLPSNISFNPYPNFNFKLPDEFYKFIDKSFDFGTISSSNIQQFREIQHFKKYLIPFSIKIKYIDDNKFIQISNIKPITYSDLDF